MPTELHLAQLHARRGGRSYALCVGIVDLGCLKRQDPQMCTFGLSGCRVKPRAVRRRGIPAERPRPTKILNTHRTDTPHHTTQHNTAQHHTSPHNLHREVLGRGSCAGWSWARLMAKKQDHEQQLSGRAAPLAKVSWAQGSGLIKKKKVVGPEVVKP